MRLAFAAGLGILVAEVLTYTFFWLIQTQGGVVAWILLLVAFLGGSLGALVWADRG